LKNKWLYLLCGAYTVFYIFAALLPTKYQYQFLDPFAYFIPLLILIYYFITGREKNWLINKIAAPYTFWIIVCAALIVACSIFATYQSIGVVVIVFMCTLTISRKYMPRVDSLVFSFTLPWLPIGLWEIVYNLAVQHFYPGWYTNTNLIIQESYDSLWVVAGLLALLYFVHKYPQIVKLQIATIEVFVLGLVFLMTWFTLKMPVNVIFHNNTVPTYVTTNSWIGVLVHTSKIWYLIPLTMLPWREDVKRI